MWDVNICTVGWFTRAFNPLEKFGPHALWYDHSSESKIQWVVRLSRQVRNLRGAYIKAVEFNDDL